MEKNNAEEQKMLPIKQMLQMGKYRIDLQLASGGFGNTYVVKNLQFDEDYAMKEFFMKGINERDDDNTTVSVSNASNKDQFAAQLEKFKKEARRLRKLNNPHIVHVHDLFEENGTAYYTMDYVDGESLAARLKREKKPLKETEALDILSQVLDALEEVHSQGIWHLDLKPGNILVDRQGVAKLIDFGASKQLSAGEGYTTTTTAMCYTPGYAPTEQVDQKMELIGPWTDLYALGATMYNLLTRNQPPTVSEMQEEDAFQYPASVSEKTRHLIQWMMAPRRQKRPQSVAEVREFLTSDFTASASATNSDDEETVFVPQSDNADKSAKASGHARTTSLNNQTIPVKWIAIGVIALIIVMVLFAALSGNKPAEGSEEIKAAIEQAKTKSVTNQYFKSALGVCSYTGPVDADEQPHGSGEATFTDGRLYRGPFVHGKMEGEDAFFRYDNGDTFEGSFVDNGFSEGRYTMKDDGSYFVGDFKNGQPAEGIWYDKSGQRIQ